MMDHHEDVFCELLAPSWKRTSNAAKVTAAGDAAGGGGGGQDDDHTGRSVSAVTIHRYVLDDALPTRVDDNARTDKVNIVRDWLKQLGPSEIGELGEETLRLLRTMWRGDDFLHLPDLANHAVHVVHKSLFPSHGLPETAPTALVALHAANEALLLCLGMPRVVDRSLFFLASDVAHELTVEKLRALTVKKLLGGMLAVEWFWFVASLARLSNQDRVWSNRSYRRLLTLVDDRFEPMAKIALQHDAGATAILYAALHLFKTQQDHKDMLSRLVSPVLKTVVNLLRTKCDSDDPDGISVEAWGSIGFAALGLGYVRWPRLLFAFSHRLSWCSVVGGGGGTCSACHNEIPVRTTCPVRPVRRPNARRCLACRTCTRSQERSTRTSGQIICSPSRLATGGTLSGYAQLGYRPRTTPKCGSDCSFAYAIGCAHGPLSLALRR